MQFIHLLQLEWKKFYRNNVIILLVGLYTLLMPIAIFVLDNVKPVPVLPDKSTFFSFPGIWEYQGYSGSWFSFLFLGFIGVLIITSEVSQKTMRQNIITGMSRTSFFLGKLYFILVISLFATFLYFISTLLIGIFNTADFTFSLVFEGNDMACFRYFLLTFGYMSFGLFLGLVLRKSGLAIFSYLSYIIFLEPLLRWAIHKKLFDDRSMNFYPMNALEDLMPNPMFKVLEDFEAMTDFNILLTYWEATIVSSLSILLFLYLGYRALIRRDM